jgi:tRNA modification GTPase
MFSVSDTIVAVATPPGRGGIGVVRVSGPDALAVARRLLTHRGDLSPRFATFTRLRAASLESPATSRQPDVIDHVVATFFAAPHSYTGEDVVELSAHGSPVVLRAIITAAMDGAPAARLAEPGEFTLRAFLNGRIDLMQAEAVADLIDAATPLQARAAFDQLEGTLTRTIADINAALFDLVARLEASVDFPEEGYHFAEPAQVAVEIDRLLARTAALVADARRGRLIREGLQVAIVGEPNVGKSSLFNALVGASRAIVTDAPGTTRDLVTETIDIAGLRVTLVDTAGLREPMDETMDVAEAEGIARSRQAVTVADLVLRVFDSRQRQTDSSGKARKGDCEQTTDTKELRVINKIDLLKPDPRLAHDAIFVSALTGQGLDDLRRAIAGALDITSACAASASATGALDAHVLRDRPEITNIRHASLVTRAHEALGRARHAALADEGSMPEEFVLADLQDARAALEEITGRRAPDDLLAHIFSKFCIGK